MNIQFTLSEIVATGMTQSEVGVEIGCTQSAISDMLRGKIGNARPSYKIVQGIRDLAARRGIDPDREPPTTERRHNKQTKEQKRGTEQAFFRQVPNAEKVMS